ncbi:uncharacterized protein LOC130957535 isoform X2 [Arachis stenosperma]|uniref:uncharacterized protein LOC130957535 isoform X2 n=1 Tax=Arachis stenosperma TaxID=217475 RepID=UPI0025AC8754|nr:uncharacterized protein LOC130957535 isoform X2 [Arachis stenosperma]
MAKNSAALAIAMLMILVITCSGAIDEFHETIPEEIWTTSYYIASGSLEYCAKECTIRYKNNLKMKKECVKNCIIRKCSQLFPTDETKQIECTVRLVAQYNKKFFVRDPMDFNNN